jgi:hypothetical protein
MNYDSLDYPSTTFYRTSPTRIGVVGITFIAIVIMILLVYIVIQYLKTLKVKCREAPVEPSDVVVGYINRNEFAIGWSRVADADSYTVYIGQSRNFDLNDSIIQANTTNLRVNISNLVEGRTYYIRLNSENSCGISNLTNSVTYIFVES